MDNKSGRRSLVWEFIVIMLIGAFGVVGPGYIAFEINEAVDMSTLNFQLLGYAIEPLIGILVIWFGYTVGIHLLSNRVFNSRGSWSNLLKLVAWALVPVAVANLLRSAVLYFAYRGVEYQEIVEEQDIAGLTGGLDPLLAPGMEEPIYLLAPIVLILGTLASAYLLIPAVQTAKDLSRSDALKAVGVVVGVHLLYLVLELVDVAGAIF